LRGWAEKGKRVLLKIAGRKFERLNIVAAKSATRLIAPMVYRESMTAPFFEGWFEQALCPNLKPNSVVVLDNARFHRKDKLEEIAAKFGQRIIFLPPYSPELNLIEKFWATLKEWLRKNAKLFDSLFDAVCHYFQAE
jgi:transposase